MQINRFIAACVLLCVVSCDVPGYLDSDTRTEARISIGGIIGSSLDVDAMFSGTETITVQSDCPWTLHVDCDWLSVYPESGQANEFYELGLRVMTRNLSDKPRYGTVTITSTGNEVSFMVSQSGYIPENYGMDDTSMSVENHPRLLVSGSDFQKIRNSVASDRVLKVIHDYIMRFADKALNSKPLEYKLDGLRLLNVSVEAFKRLFYLSYAYRFTGDRRYALKAEENILTLNDFNDWHPAHYLDCAEIMLGISIAYDWCYPVLSDATRSRTVITLKQKGLIPYFDWSGAANNWNQVCNAAALYAAVTIEEHDKDLAERVVDRAVSMLPVAMNGYSPDGAYVEGPGYWCYGTSYNVLLLDLLQRRYGNTKGLLESYPDFLKTVNYADAVVTPSYRVFNYSDQAFPAQVSIVPFYIYDLTGDESCLYVTWQLLSRSMLNYERCRHERVLPAAVVFASRRGTHGLDRSSVPPLSYVADGVTPVAVFRESWSEDASYLGIKSGSPSTGHGHMDIGTFCFESDGVQWATDLGGENYNNLEQAGVDLWNAAQGSERWTVMRCALWGHNCLMFDNQEQIVSARGEYTGKHMENGVSVDLSPLYLGQVAEVIRTVSLVGSSAHIKDWIKTIDATVLSWNMCTEAVDIVTDSSGATLYSNDGKSLRLEVTGVSGFEMKTGDAIPLRDCESRNSQKFVGFEMNLTASSEYEIIIKLIPQQ